jgi:hypothetical protein
VDLNKGLGFVLPSDPKRMIPRVQDPEKDLQDKDGGVCMTHQLEANIPDLERQAEELERKAHAIRQIIDGVRALNGDADTIVTQRSFESHRTVFEIAPLAKGGPRGPQAVLRVMHESPEREWKVIDLKREMLRRGWAPTPKAVEASVRRLRETCEIQPTSYGHYRLSRPDTADASNEEIARAMRPDHGQAPPKRGLL